MVQATLKVIAGLIVAVMGGFWLWGQSLLSQTVSATAIVLPLGAALTCAIAWWLRSYRRRISGWETSIESKLVRDRALMVVGLLVFGFLFALVLDRVGDRPHPTLVSGAIAAGWVSIGIISVVFCSVCFVGGGKA